MQLNIKLENFEGPFDLLLHLIQKNKMDIYNIKIHEITNQYLEYIKFMEEMDLEVTSEFILIAATLIEIKSKLLLPKSKDIESEEDLGKDPAAELISKLAEYKKFKLASDYFKKRIEETGAVYSKKAEIIEIVNKEKNPEDYLEKITMMDLYNLYFSLMENYNGKLNSEDVFKREIPIDKYKIENKMEYILNRLINNKREKFSGFIDECASKIEAIVVFLALLELIKLKSVKVYQESSFKDIYIQEAISDEEY
jgi:segregation and condensation protein A